MSDKLNNEFKDPSHWLTRYSIANPESLARIKQEILDKKRRNEIAREKQCHSLNKCLEQ